MSSVVVLSLILLMLCSLSYTRYLVSINLLTCRAAAAGHASPTPLNQHFFPPSIYRQLRRECEHEFIIRLSCTRYILSFVRVVFILRDQHRGSVLFLCLYCLLTCLYFSVCLLSGICLNHFWHYIRMYIRHLNCLFVFFHSPVI